MKSPQMLAGSGLCAATLAFGLLIAPTPAAGTPADYEVGSKMVLKSFKTPSGNIRCTAIKVNRKWSLRCDIFERSWEPPPGECPDFGDITGSMAMRKRKRPAFICVSDAVDARRVLRYGKVWDVGPFTCKSRRKGLKCYNLGGHGWFLSRERYRIF